MVYFTRTTVDSAGNQAIEIAVSEDIHCVDRVTARGFVPCSFEAFREAWRMRHTQMFERMREVALSAAPRERPAPREREVGGA
jgi:hypothetical protein